MVFVLRLHLVVIRAAIHHLIVVLLGLIFDRLGQRGEKSIRDILHDQPDGLRFARSPRRYPCCNTPPYSRTSWPHLRSSWPAWRKKHSRYSPRSTRWSSFCPFTSSLSVLQYTTL